jgi:hypothetical protein
MRKTPKGLVGLLVFLCGLATLYLVMSIRAGARSTTPSVSEESAPGARPVLPRVPRFVTPSSAAAPAVEVFEAPARSNGPDATASAKDEQHLYKYDLAISIGQMLNSVKLIGGDLRTRLFDQDRAFYFSYAGDIPKCSDSYLERSNLKSWSPSGSLRFHVEVKDGRLTIVGADHLPEPTGRYLPDEEFWKCYKSAVVGKMGLICKGCREGKFNIFWRLRPKTFELGQPVYDGPLMPPDRDDVFFMTNK